VDASYVADVYDELLTQAEIQGNINKVNGNHRPPIHILSVCLSLYISTYMYLSVWPVDSGWGTGKHQQSQW